MRRSAVFVRPTPAFAKRSRREVIRCSHDADRHGGMLHLLSPHVNLETHIADVVNLIRREVLSHVVMCGHSYGGCVVTAVADQISDGIDELVYLDAFVPENGQSLHDLLPRKARNAQLQGAQLSRKDPSGLPAHQI